MRISVSDHSIRIEDSYATCKFLIEDILKDIRARHYSRPIWKERTIKSMRREWVAHNALYRMNILREKTKDVCIDYPQKWYIRLGYWLLFPVFYLICR